jgi:hypothetical protein
MAKSKSKAVEGITLADLSKRYIANLEEQGKSAGTCFSYLQELQLAQREIGGETPVADLTADRIAAFNACPSVTRLKSGREKSPLSVAKTRRVLRQCLAWGAQAGLYGASPVPADNDVLPEAPPKERRKRVAALPETEPGPADTAPAPAKPRKSKRPAPEASPVESPTEPTAA